MPAYLVSRDRTALPVAGGPDHTNVMVVHAADATQAKQMASAQYEGGDASWSGATVTEIAAQSLTSLVGWQFFVGVYKAEEDDIEITYTAIANDSIDDVGAALVTALNATEIDGAAYDSTTQVLTIADAMDDAMGDRAVIVRIAPPGKNVHRSFIAQLVGTVTDEGMAAADLSVVLPADAAAFPLVYAKLEDRT